MMIEQAQITDQFQALLEMERRAAQLYAELAERAVDADARQHIEQLHRDKQRHVRLAERLLEIVD